MSMLRQQSRRNIQTTKIMTQYDQPTLRTSQENVMRIAVVGAGGVGGGFGAALAIRPEDVLARLRSKAAGPILIETSGSREHSNR